MADPFSALSIAASMLQIIDAGLKVVSATHEISKRGSTVGNKDLKIVAEDIKKVNQDLTGSLNTLSSNSAGLTDSEIALQTLAAKTSEVAVELIQALESLECRRDIKPWTSFRKALSAVWSKSKIDEIARRLDISRSELVLRVVVSLKLDERFQSVRQDQRFDTLEANAKEIAGILLDNSNFFTTGIRDIGQTILARHDLENSDAQKRHEETIAAIATLHGSHSRTRWDFESHIDRRSTLRDLREIQSEVMDFLAFRGMRDRQDEVAPNYQPTFQWIYAGPSTEDRLSTDFAQWLQNGNGCYWVSGKAGSGKSTLIKYISGEPRIKTLLSEWASGEPLMCASFYFWNAGTLLQKSQLGLLRSILHDALSRYPELAPVVFPDLCRTIARGFLDASEPSLTELTSAFVKLTTQEVLPLRICFFIDGIDEYDGDHAKLAELLLSAPSPRRKLVLSSRPTAACVDAFSSCPRLRLHDLTQQDIHLYVHENLMVHPRMQELQIRDSTSANDLVAEIVSRASGVFLWVVLVVKSLLAGFRNYDEIEILQQRLEELPTDLASLYKHMFDQMKPFYRVQASKFLQIMYHNSRISNSQPMTVLRMSLAIESNPEAAIEADIEEMPLEESIRRCGQMQRRILSYCCGLLEIRKGESDVDPIVNTNGGDDSAKLQVHFLHKSVIDFLALPEVWEGLITLTSSPNFDASVSLASSSLLEIKTAAKEYDTKIRQSRIWSLLRRGLIECAAAEACTGQARALLLNEYDAAMDYHWREIRGWIPRKGSLRSFTEAGHWSNLNPWGESLEPRFDSMFSIACKFGLKLFVKEVLDRANHPSLLYALDQGWHRPDFAQTALNQTIRQFGNMPVSEVPWDNAEEILQLILQHGANPNLTISRGRSPWQIALSRAWLEPEQYVNILEILLNYGADPNAPCVTSTDLYEQAPYRVFAMDTWQQSSLAYLRERFKDWLERAGSKTEMRKINNLWERLQALIIQKGGSYHERNEEKTVLWLYENGWEKVTDPVAYQEMMKWFG